jgi:hypothetical protein
LNLRCLNLTPPRRQRRARPGCEQISAGDPEAILFGGARVMHGHVCGFWILEPFFRRRSKSLFFDRVGPKLRLPLNFGCRSRFRFRCFRRSNPDQNLPRIPNLVSDLSGDQQFYVIFRSCDSAILGATIQFLNFVWEDTGAGRTEPQVSSRNPNRRRSLIVCTCNPCGMPVHQFFSDLPKRY